MFFTDDEQEAHKEMRERILIGQLNVSVAEVRKMLDPPKTKYRYVVVRVNL